jgi:hypothetical protein
MKIFGIAADFDWLPLIGDFSRREFYEFDHDLSNGFGGWLRNSGNELMTYNIVWSFIVQPMQLGVCFLHKQLAILPQIATGGGDEEADDAILPCLF